MTFTSLTFLLFLPLIFAAYWGARQRGYQNGMIVLASYVFYGWWDYRFCALMLASSLVDYSIGWALTKAERRTGRRGLLALSLASNLGLLGIFKYFNFFAESLGVMARTVGWQLNTGTVEIILPVGISFYTFQTLSYTIDVYRRKIDATTNLVDYLAFVSFFPQLVAGPIERASRLLPQFAQPRCFRYDRAADGCRQILWGFFKKMAIADQLALVVNPLYARPDSVAGPELAFATVCFAFQIYCDFSAYSDIAIGTAKLFGIELMRNFSYPYFSQSISEFWRRWHISLSTWFRDYVYLPLGGNRSGKARSRLNVLVTFFVSGLWHGAAWNFVVWGGVNGALTAATKSSKRQGASSGDVPGGELLIPPLGTIARILVTFGIVCLCWVFFRARSIADALLILAKISGDLFSPAAYSAFMTRIADDSLFKNALLVIAVLIVIEWIQRRHPHPLHLERLPQIVRWGVYTLLIWGTLDWMGNSQEFIYFAF